MTQHEMEIAILNLQNNLNALMSRNTNGRIDDTKGEVRATKAEIKTVSDETVENAITMADFMEEYYMQQYE